MRFQGPLLFLLSIGWASSAGAEVVDVSREWNEHASSVTALGIQKSLTSEPPEVSSVARPSVCKCESLTTQEKLSQATYAFTGVVFEVGPPKKGRRTVLFDVDEIFKGSPKPEVAIVTAVVGTECDLVFEEGKSYLVYAQWEWGSAVTARCMGTQSIEKAKRDADALGPSEAMKEKLYIRLRNACMGRIDTACCLSSLKEMRVGYDVPEPDDGCPDGTTPDRLRCAGSYTWCIPNNEKSHR